MNELFLSGLRLKDMTQLDSYVSALPVVRHLQQQGGLELHSPVTFLVGENGAGKSTLLEAIAVAWGFNAEGGTRNFSFSTAATHSPLSDYLRLERGVNFPRDGFFLRAESFYNVASEIDRLGVEDYYGGSSLHRQSHGESFLSLVCERFGGHGLYILDEPEAALSPSRQLTLLARLHQLVRSGSQFIIATHSPLLMAYPGAELYVLAEDGVRLTPYRETEHYQLSRQFLDDPERMLRYLLEE